MKFSTFRKRCGDGLDGMTVPTSYSQIRARLAGTTSLTEALIKMLQASTLPSMFTITISIQICIRNQEKLAV